jgi:hypothetical protein
MHIIGIKPHGVHRLRQAFKQGAIFGRQALPFGEETLAVVLDDLRYHNASGLLPVYRIGWIKDEGLHVVGGGPGVEAMPSAARQFSLASPLERIVPLATWYTD